MGMGRLAEIADALIAAGLSPAMAVAVVCDATTPRQRVLVTTLVRVAADVAAQGLSAPSIIAIGEMVKLRAALTPFAVTLADGP
jgi:uroporphyrin-III C-methyltransferase